MIGNCDCCDRVNVPGHVVNCSGEPFACFICQGETDDDPFCEREQPCFTCGGDGGFDDGERCEDCQGTGTEWAEPQPMTANDLAEMCGDDQTALPHAISNQEPA